MYLARESSHMDKVLMVYTTIPSRYVYVFNFKRIPVCDCSTLAYMRLFTYAEFQQTILRTPVIVYNEANFRDVWCFLCFFIKLQF